MPGSRNAVIGSGRIRGRKICLTADDFSVRGGHADGGIGMKAVYGEVHNPCFFSMDFHPQSLTLDV